MKTLLPTYEMIRKTHCRPFAILLPLTAMAVLAASGAPAMSAPVLKAPIAQQAQAPALTGATTVVDRLLAGRDGVRTSPSYPATGVWGILAGSPQESVGATGLAISKPGQAVIYPCAGLLGKDAGSIEFSVSGSDDDDTDHVLLDTWSQSGSRIKLIEHRGTLTLSFLSDNGVDNPIAATASIAGGTVRIAILYDRNDITLTVNGAPVGKALNPILPSSEPVALILGNDRSLQAPSKFAFSSLRLSTGRSTAAGSLPVVAAKTPDEQLLDTTLAYQERLNPVIDKLRASTPDLAAYLAATAAYDVQDYTRTLSAVAPVAANATGALYVPAVMLQASILRAQKDYGAAFDKLQSLAVSSDARISIQAQLAQASLLHEQGSIDEAKQIISNLISHYHDRPELAEAYLMIADDLAVKGDWEGVLTSTEQITGGGSEQFVPIGQPLEIRIADTALQARSSDAGLPVTVTSSNGDKEQIVLRPAFSQGVYFGSIDTALGNAKPGDGVLQVVGGGTAKIEYVDKLASDGVNVPRTITVGFATEAKVTVMAQAALKVYQEVVQYQKANLLDENWVVIGDLPDTASDFFRDPDDGSLPKKGTRFDPTFLSTIRPGQSVYVELDEPDLDPAAGLGTATVEVRSSGRKMPVTLTETAPHSGLFGGTIKTALVGSPADSALPVSMNDVVTGRYVNPRAASVHPSRIPHVESAVHVATTAGTLTVGAMLDGGDGDKQFVRAWRIAKETPVVIQVEDRDLDTSDAADTATVHVQASGGASTDAKLAETGAHTGVFTGTLAIGAGGIKATPGEIVTVTYHDAENPTGKPVDVVEQFKVNIGENAAFSLERQVKDTTPDENATPAVVTAEPKTEWVATKALVPGYVYRATLLDPDVLPTSVGEFKTIVTLKVSTGATLDLSLVSVADEDNRRNVFQGEFYVRLGESDAPTKAYFSQTGAPVKITEGTDIYTLPSIPALNVYGNSTVIAAYTEPLTADGRRNVPRSWPLHTGSDATITAVDERDIVLDTLKPGMPFTLRIEDPTADKGPTRGAIKATITSSAGASLPVTLTETDVHSGIFEADIATTSTPGLAKPVVNAASTKAEGPLFVSFAGKVTVSYLNANTESGTPVTRQLVLPTNPVADTSAIMLSKVFDDPKFEAEALVRLGESLYAVGAAKLTTTDTPAGTGTRTNPELQQAAKILEDVATRFRGSDYTVEALYLTAKIRREERRFDEAEALLKRVVDDYPDSDIVAQALYQQVELEYDRGDIDGATEAAMHLAQAFPNDPVVMDAFLKVAEYYYSKNQFEKAANIYNRTINRFPDNPKAPLVAYRAATAYYKAGVAGQDDMFGKAVKAYIDFASRYRDNEYADAAMYWAAIASEKLKDDRKAYTILTKLLITYPSSDMKAYVIRERDKLKEDNPNITADDDL